MVLSTTTLTTQHVAPGCPHVGTRLSGAIYGAAVDSKAAVRVQPTMVLDGSDINRGPIGRRFDAGFFAITVTATPRPLNPQNRSSG